ncbi:MFS general substrate transporter [Mycena maculata]|uniref:MFS general substrate transporter n=1 Tax=Mycena maculata TaxID=230809 RepID=A0AAD7JX24_9AGAR|nr:MFS general substrate transporter [Mycena maculata]
MPYSSSSPARRGIAFWLIFASICISLFVSALELTTVSTALPTIANDLHVTEFVWVGTAYSLASTAFLPMSGGLAEIFGRRHAMLLSILLFAMGSALCGAARDQYVLIGGRTVQGLGGGGIRSLAVIILADLVTLEERGTYGILTGLTWSIACVVGPIIGGGLAARGAWRWLFYLNLPISGVAAVFVVLFLHLPTPPGTFREKIGRLDLIGNFLVIASTTCCTLALTWGGAAAPWTSLQVLAPLWLGLIGLAIFLLYEGAVPADPLVPFVLMCNRTSLSGYVQAFVVGLVTLCVVCEFSPHYFDRHRLIATADFLPVYFQSCKDASAIRSALLGLGVAALAPAAIVAGVAVSKTQRYRPQMWAGWCIIIIGLGLLRSVRQETPTIHTFFFGVITGVGLGFEYSTTMFPVQAPLPVSQNARALAFLTFVGSFAGVWGLTIGGTILDNQLTRRLPAAFTAHIPGGAAVAYAIIPQIQGLPPVERHTVQVAFAESLAVVWAVLVAIAGIGLLASLFMEGLPLHTKLDSRWALRDPRRTPVLRFEMVPVPVVQVDFGGINLKG